MTILAEVRSYLTRTNTAPGTFGRMAVSDPRIVFDMLAGREPMALVTAKLRFHMEQNPDGHPRRYNGSNHHVTRTRRDQGIEINVYDDYQRPYHEHERPHTDSCPLCGTAGFRGCHHRAPYQQIVLKPQGVFGLDNYVPDRKIKGPIVVEQEEKEDVRPATRSPDHQPRQHPEDRRRQSRLAAARSRVR